jgi:peroxiredoxin
MHGDCGASLRVSRIAYAPPGCQNCEPVSKIMMQQQDARDLLAGRKRRYWRHILEAALLAGLLFGLHRYQIRDVPRGPAPPFQAVLLDGTSIALHDYRGRPLLLQFWATWCPVCKLEQGSLDAIARDYPVLTIALDSLSAAELRRWMTDRGLVYPVARDPEGRIAQRYGVKGVPVSVIVDTTGNVRFVEVGYTTEIGLRIRLWWVSR